jgi:F-type H+-transporting ATPase subunit beta
MLVTGIKVIDLLAPLRRGGTIYLSGTTGVGVMALLGEWTHGLWMRGRGCAVFVDWPARPVQVDDLVREWREQGIELTQARRCHHR